MEKKLSTDTMKNNVGSRWDASAQDVAYHKGQHCKATR